MMPTTSSGELSQDGSNDLATAGFRACAQEAIRFLIEEENLPGDDPLVVGLWRHLVLQELSLDLNSLISQDAAEGDSGIQDITLPQELQDDGNCDSSSFASLLRESAFHFASDIPGASAVDSFLSPPLNENAEATIRSESSSSA